MTMMADSIEIRSVTKRGGSLSVNIPPDVAKKMNLAPGCPVVFQYDSERNRIVIEKLQSVNTEKGRTINLSENIC